MSLLKFILFFKGNRCHKQRVFFLGIFAAMHCFFPKILWGDFGANGSLAYTVCSNEPVGTSFGVCKWPKTCNRDMLLTVCLDGADGLGAEKKCFSPPKNCENCSDFWDFSCNGHIYQKEAGLEPFGRFPLHPLEHFPILEFFGKNFVQPFPYSWAENKNGVSSFCVGSLPHTIRSDLYEFNRFFDSSYLQNQKTSSSQQNFSFSTKNNASGQEHPLQKWTKIVYKRLKKYFPAKGANYTHHFLESALNDPKTLLALEKHLWFLGYMSGQSFPNSASGTRCIEALKTFQKVHDLPITGKLDSDTLTLLNIPVKNIFLFLKKGLEFWNTLGSIPKAHLIVNVPQYAAYGFDSGDWGFSTRISVGKPATPTPILRMTLTQGEIFPSWYVPRKFYERFMHMVGKNGFVLENGFLVQKESPSNSMGVLKFLPGVSGILLHGNGNPKVMEKSYRAIGLGCIRLHDILGFFDFVMSPLANRGLAEKALESQKNCRINFPPFSVIILYQGALGCPGKKYHESDSLLTPPHKEPMKKFLAKNIHGRHTRQKNKNTLRALDPKVCRLSRAYDFLNHPTNPHASEIFLILAPDVYKKYPIEHNT